MSKLQAFEKLEFTQKGENLHEKQNERKICHITPSNTFTIFAPGEFQAELQKAFKLAQALFSPKSEQKVIQFQICRQVQLGGHYSCLATSQQRNVTKMGRCEAAAKI